MQIERLGTPLNRFILEEERNYPKATGSLSIGLITIETASKILASQIRRAGLIEVLGTSGHVNVQGESTQKLDEISDSIFINHLSASRQFYSIASEEREQALFPEEGKDSRYIIAIDPLDGSSNVEVNVSTGSIFAIYKRKNGIIKDFFQKPKDIVSAGYILYGSSTMLVYSTGQGVNGFTLDPLSGNFLLSHPNISIPKSGTIYSFSESRSPFWRNSIREFVDGMKQKGFKNRYTGSMVADIHRTLILGGIFGYPQDREYPEGKLRVLYEVFPMCFLVGQAQGRACFEEGSEENLKIESLHQRSSVFLGSPKNIQELEKDWL